MFGTSLLLLGVFLASIIDQSQSFEIKIGSAASLLKDFNLNSIQEVEKSGLFVRRTLIFPYDVYEMKTHASTAVEAKSYLFVKMPYELLAESFDLQTRSLLHANQYQILYKRIPQIAFFEGKTNEYLELIREDPSLYNPHFIIKNSTLANRLQGKYMLNFYSIRIAKYMQRIIKAAHNERRSSLKKNQVAKILTNDSHFTTEKIEQNQHEANQFVLTKFLDNGTYYKTIYPSEIFNVEMIRQITNDTLWAAKYQGFTIYFSSAVSKSSQKINQNKDNMSQNASFIDLFIIALRQSEQKRVQHVKQPLQYLNLSSISHLDICFTNEKLKLLLADNNNIYLIDVSTHLWNLDMYKTDLEFQRLFFDHQCRIFKTLGRVVSQIDGVKKMQFDNSILSVQPLQNVIIFCLEGSLCKVYSKNLVNQLLDIKLAYNLTKIDTQEIIRVNGSLIQHYIGYRQKWGHYQLQQMLDQFQIIQTSSSSNFSFFYEFMYPYETYLKKKLIRQKQMDKMFYYHLQFISNRQIYRLPSNYYQFSQKLSMSNCTEQTRNESDQIYKIINTKDDWSVCTISISTNNLHLFTIKTDNAQSKMYVCQSPIQNYSSNQEINCQLYTAAANTEKSYYISSYKQIKFYLLRVPKQRYFPTFYFRDIQKQQLAFASAVFFFLMLSLAIFFLFIILFIVFRPLVVAMMIYFGWREDLAVPTYPLGWLQLKIKIKKLVEMNFLKYVPHQPKNEDEDNHCCFCLQNLAKQTVIAQLYCQHQFHKECFNQWIKNEPNLRCPTCRRQFTRQHLHQFRSTHNLIG